MCHIPKHGHTMQRLAVIFVRCYKGETKYIQTLFGLLVVRVHKIVYAAISREQKWMFGLAFNPMKVGFIRAAHGGQLEDFAFANISYLWHGLGVDGCLGAKL